MITQNRPNRKRIIAALALIPLLALTACVGPLKPPTRITPSPSPTSPPMTVAVTVPPALTHTPPPTPSPSPMATPEPTPAPTPEPEIIISFIGDCTLGGDPALGQLEAFGRVLNANGGDMGYFFQNALPFTGTDDLTIVNLEGPLTALETGAEKTFAFRGDPSYVGILENGGVEAVTLANNHTLDYGTEGYADTLAALDEANVLAADTEKPVIFEAKGYKIGIAAGKFPTRERVSRLVADITALREAGCAVVAVMMHWGIEGAEAPEPAIQAYARKIVDAGADIVVGHHPHILQGIEEYNGRIIAYSLGNFVFGGNRKPAERETAILQQRFTIGADGLTAAGFRIVPFTMSSASGNDYQPVHLEGDDALRVYERINTRGALIEGGIAVAGDWQ